MKKLIYHLLEARRRHIAIKIAKLEAKIEYWERQTTVNGTQPEHLCERIASMKGQLAGLRVAYNQEIEL